MAPLGPRPAATDRALLISESARELYEPTGKRRYLSRTILRVATPSAAQCMSGHAPLGVGLKNSSVGVSDQLYSVNQRPRGHQKYYSKRWITRLAGR